MTEFDKFNPLIDPKREAALLDMKKKVEEELARRGELSNDDKARALTEGINERTGGRDLLSGLPADSPLAESVPLVVPPPAAVPEEAPVQQAESIEEPSALPKDPPDELIVSASPETDLEPDLVEGVKEGIETLEAEDLQQELDRPELNPRSSLRAEKALREDIIAHTKKLIQELGGNIPSRDEVRSSLLTALENGRGARAVSMNDRERTFFNSVYKEMARGVFVFPAEEARKSIVEETAVAPAVPEETPALAEDTPTAKEDPAWDALFPTPQSSWLPERKGVVGRAAGSVSDEGGKQGEKNADGEWIFDEKFKEEKRKEMEKQLAMKVFEEKKKPELIALFEAETAAADVLGHFDDSYLLKMIIDKRKNVPLDPDEVALFRKLYEDRYARAPSPEVKVERKPEEAAVDAETEKKEQEEIDEAWRTIFDGGALAGEETTEDYSEPVLGMTPEEVENIEKALVGGETPVTKTAPHSTEVAKPETTVSTLPVSEIQKLNSIRVLLQPEKDPLDPRNDRETLVIVQLAFNEGKLGGAEMSDDLKRICAAAGKNVGERGGGIGTIKAAWVAEAFALGKAIHDRGGEVSAPAAVSSMPETPIAPAATVPETPPTAATPVTPVPPTPDDMAYPDLSALGTVPRAEAPAPEIFSDIPRAPKETVEAAKKEIENWYLNASEEERKKISAGLLNWGWNVKKLTGDMIVSAVQKVREQYGGDAQIFDAFQRRWEKNANIAKLQLDTAKTDRLKEEAGLKVSGFGKLSRKAQSVGIVAGTAARIGRPIASAFGLMPLGGVMLTSLGIAETAGVIKDYNEISVANTTRKNEDYRKQEGESEEDYTARTSGGAALDEAWAMYEEAKNKNGGEAPNKQQIDAEYLKTLPRELKDRLNKTTMEVRDKWFQGWMQERVKKKIRDIHEEVLNADTEEKKAKILRKRRGTLEKYGRMIEEAGTIHTFGLAAVQAEKINKAIVTGFSVDSWRRAAVGMWHLASHFASGEARLGVPVAVEAGAPVRGGNDGQVEKTALAYDDLKQWLGGQKDRKVALEAIQKKLEDSSVGAAQKTAMTQLLAEEAARPKPTPAVDTAPKAPVETPAAQKPIVPPVEPTPKAQAPTSGPKQAPVIPETGGAPKVEVVPTEVVRHMNNLTTERVISDYIVNNQAAARRLGWNGEDDLANWAAVRANTMWSEHANNILKNDVALTYELQNKGYSPDPAGYAEYIKSDPSRAIKIDIANNKVEVVGKDYFTQDAAVHQGKDAATIREAEERLNEAVRKTRKAGTPVDDDLVERLQQKIPVAVEERQTFNALVRSGNADSMTRTEELARRVRSGKIDPAAFMEYYRQVTGANTQDMAGMRTAFEKVLHGTSAEQNSAQLSLTPRMQALINAQPERPAAAGQFVPEQGRVAPLPERVITDSTRWATSLMDRGRADMSKVTSAQSSEAYLATYFTKFVSEYYVPKEGKIVYQGSDGIGSREYSEGDIKLLLNSAKEMRQTLENLNARFGVSAYGARHDQIDDMISKLEKRSSMPVFNGQARVVEQVTGQQPTSPGRVFEQQPAVGRPGREVTFREGTGQESVYWAMKAIPLNRVIDGPGESIERARRLLEFSSRGQLDADTFAHYYMQRIMAQSGQPRLGPDGRKLLVFAGNDEIAAVRGIFDRYARGGREERLQSAQELGMKIAVLTRRQ